MKHKKTFFILEQIIMIAITNYIILFESNFIYKTHWKPTFAFALAFYHIGTFMSLYFTFKIKEFTNEKENVLFTYNMFFLLGFTTLLVYHNLHMVTDNLITTYTIGLTFLMLSIILLFETYNSYYKYKSSININLKN
jgi:hypothetical protein